MLMSKKDYLEFIFFMCCTLITLMIMKLIWSMDNCLVGNINRLLDLSLIDILLEKKRLPNSTRELEEWYINYFDKNEIYKNQINHDLFIDLAILYMHEKNYLNSYKYHLLNIELNSENNASTNSINNIEFIKENLNKNSINYTNLNLKKYSSAFIK